jgi:hypothetical protein
VILIPEIKTVLILVPRTGSGSLRRAVMAAYPEAMLIYRHMEADGVPHGYDHWAKVGVIRNPVERLWSLYKFLRNFGGDHDPAYIAAMRASARRSFSSWVTENEVVFTSPYDRSGRGRFFPGFTVRHPLPENRKSQQIYLRPDLGTEIIAYEDLELLADRLSVVLDSNRSNVTPTDAAPDLDADAARYLQTWFAWDFETHARTWYR